MLDGLSTITSTMFGSLLDGALSDDDLNLAPIPAFYFEADFFNGDGSPAKDFDAEAKEGFVENRNNFTEGSGGGMLDSLAAALPTTSMLDALNPGGEWNVHKAFIEINGLEVGLEGKKTFNEGGYNFPIDLPDKMKNSAITLKRLMRPLTIDPSKDKWRKWYEHTMNCMAFWEEKLNTMIVQVCVMHPNLGSDGKPIILSTLNFYDAFPSKVTMSSLNSTGEDLLTEEIEISYSNMVSSYNDAI